MKTVNEHDIYRKRKETTMIKAKYIAITDTGEYYSVFALDLEEALNCFRRHNIQGKCKELGTDRWTEI